MPPSERPAAADPHSAGRSARTIRLRTVGYGLLAATLGGLGCAALVVWLGVYDISATNQHTAPVFRLLDYAMRRSVQARADGIVAPPLDEAPRVLAGAVHYRAHCVQCHGAPGVAPNPLAFGLTPAPANLLAAGRRWPPAEVFWVVKHGIKMSGMPAWGPRLSDDDIWDVVAFVRGMTRLSPAEYARLASALPGPSATDRAAAAAPQLAPGRAPNVQAGREATRRYLCATCHVIPGIVGASHHVGPPLAGMGARTLIAGVIPNTPQNMVRFLKNPQAIDPLSAMPALGVTDQDARDITAFLASLN